MSRYLKTEGLIIRSSSYGEADKLLNLLTLEGGRLPAIAKGACKPGSRLSGPVLLFTRGDYLLYKGKTLFTLTQGEILDSYQSLRDDLEKYAYGQYFCELMGRVLEEREPCPEMYLLLRAAFEALLQGGDLETLARAYELKLLKGLGYAPYLGGCLACSRQVVPGSARLSCKEGGLLCPRCSARDKGALKLSPGSLPLLQRLLTPGFSRLKVLRLSPIQKKELLLVTKGLLGFSTSLGPCKSLAFLEELGLYETGPPGSRV